MLLRDAFESPDDFLVDDFAAGAEAGSLLAAGAETGSLLVVVTLRTARGLLRICQFSLSISICFSLKASWSIVGRKSADVEDDDRSPARSL